MSSHWAPEFGYGMLLNNKEADAMLKKTLEIEGEEGDTDLFILQNFFDDIIIIDHYDVTGAKYLTTKKTIKNADGAMFYGSKHGTVLADKVEDCYKDIHEMVQEFRKTYGEYLPADFDYEAHMVLFWGANRG